MGGIGYITANLADIARNNILINAHMLEASRLNGIQRFLFSSSACVYAGYKQNDADVTPLREEDAHPADPEAGYGWEKLFTEQLCRYYLHDFGFETRIVRFHNVYGPLGTYEGGKEKAPAAISRKVALARGRRVHRSLGRWQTDPLVHVHRRLHRRPAAADGQRPPRAAQSGHRGVGQRR